MEIENIGKRRVVPRRAFILIDRFTNETSGAQPALRSASFLSRGPPWTEPRTGWWQL
jgi:hypothetical protein